MRKYLACYDYGQGGLWSYIWAESREDIEATFSDLIIFETPPPWWTDEIEKGAGVYRIGEPLDGLFLEKLKR